MLTPVSLVNGVPDRITLVGLRGSSKSALIPLGNPVVVIPLTPPDIL